MPQCTAKSKQTGQRCKRGAADGYSVCYWHGGAPGSGLGKRIYKHARYSHSLPKDLAERYEYFKSDPNLMSLKPEIALARAHFERFMGSFVEGQPISAAVGAELRAWHLCISQLAERCQRILYGDQYTVTVQGVAELTARWATVVGEVIDAVCDPETGGRLKAHLSDRLASVGLPGREPETGSSSPEPV